MVARPATRSALASNVRDAIRLVSASRDLLSPYEARIVETLVQMLSTFAAGLEGRVTMTPPEGP